MAGYEEQLKTYITAEELKTMKQQIFGSCPTVQFIDPGIAPSIPPEPKIPVSPAYTHAGYLEKIMRRENLLRTIKECKDRLVRMQLNCDLEFDTLAFRGISGLMIGPALATELGKEMIVVRKPDDCKNSHSRLDVEGFRHARKYIVIDDLMSSGDTVKAIVGQVQKFAPHAIIQGVLLYNNMTFYNRSQLRGLGHIPF